MMSCESDVLKLTRKSTKYSSGMNNSVEIVLLSFSIFTDQEILPVEQTVLSYDSVDATGDVGGYLGLLLGVSFMYMIRCLYKRFHWAFQYQRFKSACSGWEKVQKL